MEAEFDWEAAWKDAEDNNTHVTLLSENSMRLVNSIRSLWERYVATFVVEDKVPFADLVAGSTGRC